MKKILFLAIIIIACVCLTACGGNGGKVPNGDVSNNGTPNIQEPVEEISQPIVEEENTSEENNSYNDDESVVFGDEIIEFEDEPNRPPKEDVVVTTIDPSAEGLVFAFFQKKDGIKTFGDVLENYTTDYTTIKRKDGTQRRVFLGFKLDENNRILRAYACGIYKGTLFALEGSQNGEYFESNKAIINRLYQGVDVVDKGYHYYIMDAEVHVDVWDNGYASTFYDLAAEIDSHGQIFCD